MKQPILLAMLPVLALAACGSKTEPGNQTSDASTNTITALDENAADAGLANIVDVAPDDGDAPGDNGTSGDSNTQ
jgi:uncharacterized lipoprotein